MLDGTKYIENILLIDRFVLIRFTCVAPKESKYIGINTLLAVLIFIGYHEQRQRRRTPCNASEIH